MKKEKQVNEALKLKHKMQEDIMQKMSAMVKLYQEQGFDEGSLLSEQDLFELEKKLRDFRRQCTILDELRKKN